MAQFLGEKVELSLGSEQAQNLEKGFVCAWGELFLKSQAGLKVHRSESRDCWDVGKPSLSGSGRSRVERIHRDNQIAS